MARKDRPELPEITEFEAQRHYLHLSQMTLGMMGVSLFGTCTMKYNSKTAEYATLRPELAEVHPYQHPDTLQGVLESCTTSTASCDRSRAWTSSSSRPAAAPMRPTR
jgi:glycine dehydrogenase subunit 2